MVLSLEEEHPAENGLLRGNTSASYNFAGFSAPARSVVGYQPKLTTRLVAAAGAPRPAYSRHKTAFALQPQLCGTAHALVNHSAQASWCLLQLLLVSFYSFMTGSNRQAARDRQLPTPIIARNTFARWLSTRDQPFSGDESWQRKRWHPEDGKALVTTSCPQGRFARCCCPSLRRTPANDPSCARCWLGMPTAFLHSADLMTIRYDRHLTHELPRQIVERDKPAGFPERPPGRWLAPGTSGLSLSILADCWGIDALPNSLL